MKMIYMILKKQSDFCQNVAQFKSLLSSNVRISFSEDTLQAEHKELSYKITANSVDATQEVVFYMEVTAKQENDSDKVKALESFDAVLRRVSENYRAFQINTVWDELSLYYGNKLYPEISELEALLREIIYRFMINNMGSQWLKKRTPQKVQDELGNTAKKNQVEEYETDSLMYADFITLGYFFFVKYPLKMNINELFAALKDTENQTDDKIRELIEQYESKSNWDRYFSEKITVDNLFEKWNTLYGYRNQVAHTKRISKSDYTQTKKIVDELKPKFLECLNHLDDVELTEEQSEAVEEVAEQTITPRQVYVRGGRGAEPLLYGIDASQIVGNMGNALLQTADITSRLGAQANMTGITGALGAFAKMMPDPNIWGVNSAAIKLAEATRPLSETLGNSLLFTDHQSELEKQLSSIGKIARESMEDPHEKMIKELEDSTKIEGGT